MKTLADIQSELKAINRRMWRFRDSGDVRGMIKIKARIAKLKVDLELLREKCRPRFRRSYGFDQFIELLATGRKKDHARA
jgi:hypothetical protein